MLNQKKAEFLLPADLLVITKTQDSLESLTQTKGWKVLALFK